MSGEQFGTGSDGLAASVVVDLTSVSATSGGGVGRVATGVVDGLASIGVSTRCLVAPGTAAAWRDLLPGADLSEVAVKMAATSGWQNSLRSKMPASLKTSRLVGAVRRVRSGAVKTAAGTDVVWYPFHRSLATAVASVVTVHDLRVFERDFASVMDQRIIEENVRNARALVCSWPHPFDSLIERFPEAEKKSFQIPLPVLNPGRPRATRRTEAQPVTLIYPGYVTEHKDHETLIRALALLPDVRLICTGAETPYARTVRDLADDLGVADRIEWRGYVDETELENAYEEADVLVMPSLWEAASGPVLEAVVRQLPFVASDIPPLRAQVAQLGLHADDWLFPPRDSTALAGAIERAVSSHQSRVDELKAPAQQVGSRTWETTASDYERVFNWANGTGELPADLQGKTR
ncbi:glycosyltransferase [Diaminobutyricibacter sp. McL0608]|uniref:glycosyltransferase n=1 Tax=Leifsonia sp. McL0608 TaxID=3143537 RepID=UPI0031F2F5BE